ncbi:CHAT domain-containing protein [Flavobacterium faecale]|uniref:CHAT domain-containing protein n=1 Tax=Flavobacterium faecale TaxID=1355330 RepID=UPI003AAA7A64
MSIIKCFFYLILLFFCTSNCYSQNEIDSITYYYQKGDIDKSIKIAEELKDNYRIKTDTINFNYAYLLNSLGTLYMSNMKYKVAENYYLQSINLLENYKEKDSLIFASFYNNLALLYRNTEQYLNAGPLFQTVKDIMEQHLSQEDTDYIYSLLNLGFIAKKLNDNEKAKLLYIKGLDLQQKVFGITHYEVANTLNNLGEIYYKEAKYAQAEEYFAKSREIYKKSLGENDLAYLNVSSNFVDCLIERGDYSQAKSILNDILEKYKNYYNESNLETILSIYRLGLVYKNLGDNVYAEKLYKEALAKISKEFNNNYYSIVINELANLYNFQGKNKEAETLYLENIKLSKETFGEFSRDYATSISNLASFYHNILNFEKAEKLYIQALELNKSIIGKDHPNCQIILQNLSGLYLDIGLYDKAEMNAIISKELFEKIYSKDHPQYSGVLNNLANILARKGKQVEAEKLYLQSEKIILSKFEINHPYYISFLKNLAALNFDQKKYNKAKEYYSKIVEISKSDYSSIKMLAIIDDLLGEFNSVSVKYNELFVDFKTKVNYSSSYLSTVEFNTFIKKYFFDRFFPLSFLHRHVQQFDNINIGCYENELLVKNLSLRNQQRIAKSIQKSDDTVLQNKYNEFLQFKRQLVKLNELPLNQRPAHYEQLVTETESLEKELVRSSSTFAEAKNSLTTNWKQVQEKLKSNELAIDFVSFHYYNKKWTDSIIYTAFVVGKDFKIPKYISLFEQKQLSFLLERNKDIQDSTRIDKQYTEKAISDLFLKPLEKELKGMRTVYLSPSGLGNQINFSALPINKNSSLGHDYQIHVLGSTAEITNYKTTFLDIKKDTELLLYGNIDYNKSAELNSRKTDSLPLNIDDFAAFTRSSTGTEKHGYLKGSKTEIDKIHTLATQNNFASRVVEDRVATEESIKLLDGRTTPFVLHIATHGFFFPDPKKELPDNRSQFLDDSNTMNRNMHYKISDDPMMRAGLLFAGANKYWGKPTEKTITDDGILTASEIANLDLSACQLVVLSACETGLGEINGAEGVFGLQRAFKMAGVKNIIMSLWKVPDVQTAELFAVFYKECFAGKSIHEAFQIAQAKMKDKYSPYYWAGFVLLE